MLACAPRETIAAAAREAQKRGLMLVADLLGLEDDMAGRLALLSAFEVPMAEIHCGIDEQHVGKDPFERLRTVAAMTDLRLAVAGGLGPANLSALPKVSRLEVVIVGGAITRAADPGSVAREVAALLAKEG